MSAAMPSSDDDGTDRSRPAARARAARRVDETGEQRAVGRVDRQATEALVSRFELGHRARGTSRGGWRVSSRNFCSPASQCRYLPSVIAAKGPARTTVFAHVAALEREHLRRVAHDAALLRHLALQLDPELLEILGRGQLLAASEALEQVAAVAELGADQRLPGLAGEIGRHLTHDAEELAHLAEPLAQLRPRPRRSRLRSRCTTARAAGCAPLRPSVELRERLIEQALLLLLRREEGLLALAVLLALDPEALRHELEQLVERGLGIGRGGGRWRAAGSAARRPGAGERGRRDRGRIEDLESHQLAPSTVTAAGSGSWIRSGADCLRAMRRPCRIAVRYSLASRSRQDRLC